MAAPLYFLIFTKFSLVDFGKLGDLIELYGEKLIMLQFVPPFWHMH